MSGAVQSRIFPATYRVFKETLLSACALQSLAPAGEIRLGLALSGGVDSMALAVLCKEFASEYAVAPIRLFGFVVDHKARPESTDDASTAKQNIERLGIPTKILSLVWPASSESPGELKGFETQARKLRYQTLGHACAAHKCHALLTGHHSDDVAETLFFRIQNGARGSGLTQPGFTSRGIPYSGDCHQLAGDTILPNHRGERPNLPGRICDRLLKRHPGLQMLRPLLSIPKHELQATCDTRNISWVEDSTNQDSSFTPRNVIRKLLLEVPSRLPRSLHTNSLLRLQATKREQMNDIQQSAIMLSSHLKLKSFNLRTGSITISVPIDLPEQCKTFNLPPGYNYEDGMNLLLEQLSMILSPRAETLPKKSFFSRLLSPKSDGMVSEVILTSRGLLYELEDVLEGGEHRADQAVPRRRISFHRQPPSSIESSSIQCNKEILPNSSHDTGDSWSDFWLWDERFWVRILNMSAKPVSIQFFSKEAEQSLREDAIEGGWARDLKLFLKMIGSARLRCTIPVIMQDGKVISFPSLLRSEKGHSVQWEVRYKHIEIPIPLPSKKTFKPRPWT